MTSRNVIHKVDNIIHFASIFDVIVNSWLIYRLRETVEMLSKAENKCAMSELLISTTSVEITNDTMTSCYCYFETSVVEYCKSSGDLYRS